MGTRRITRLAGALVAAGLTMPMLGFHGASAGTPCVSRSTRAAFTALGDYNQYFLAPGGDFEGGNWQGTGTVVFGSEPWAVNGIGWSSLRVAPGTWVMSETFCVAAREDSIRLFVNRPGVRGSKLRVTIEVHSLNGSTQTPVTTSSADISGDLFGWAPSPRIAIPDVRNSAGEQWMTLKFWTTGTNATWQIDDVMVDPWKTK